MKFDDLDAQLRVFETTHDQRIPEDVFPVARLDGRGFTRLTKEVLDLEAPFDIRFRDPIRRRLRRDLELPTGEACGRFVRGLLEMQPLPASF